MRNKGSDRRASQIDATAIRRIFRRFYADLQAHEQLINDLNVFPVPDGDTGTNSALTIQAGLLNLDKGRSSVVAVLGQIAEDASLGARGNSGVILAEYVRGLAESAKPDVDAHTWSEMLKSAATCASQAVSLPREGTMLTVASVVAEICVPEEVIDDNKESDGDTEAKNFGSETMANFAAFAGEVSRAARAALALTTEQLPELRAAGVVDSGAMVLTLFHDAVASELLGVAMPEIELAQRTCDVSAIEYHGPTFEVMFLFEADLVACESLREELGVVGESVTVSGRESPFRVHVHVDQPADAISEALKHGRVRKVEITKLLLEDTLIANDLDGIGVVCACDCAGLRDLVESTGAQYVSVASTVAPATREFIDAARKLNRANVVILPSNTDSQASAALAAHQLRANGILAHVINTTSVPASLSALAVFDASHSISEVVDSMSQAARATRSVVVTHAARSTMTALGMCHQGDTIALVDNTPFAISKTASSEDMVINAIHDLLDDGGEVVTIIMGRNGDESIVEGLRADFPEVEFAVYWGNQTHTDYVVGVE